jgi:hypothetical protein
MEKFGCAQTHSRARALHLPTHRHIYAHTHARTHTHTHTEEYVICWIILSSGLLRSVGWFRTDVSELLIGPFLLDTCVITQKTEEFRSTRAKACDLAWHLLLVHGNSGLVNSPQCYVIRTSPVLFVFHDYSNHIQCLMPFDDSVEILSYHNETHTTFSFRRYFFWEC